MFWKLYNVCNFAMKQIINLFFSASNSVIVFPLWRRTYIVNNLVLRMWITLNSEQKENINIIRYTYIVFLNVFEFISNCFTPVCRPTQGHYRRHNFMLILKDLYFNGVIKRLFCLICVRIVLTFDSNWITIQSEVKLCLIHQRFEKDWFACFGTVHN